MSTSPEVSVIVRAYNEERHIGALLASIREQQYGHVEIIVVDSGSIDRTRSIAASLADVVLSIDSGDFTFGYSLNVGLRRASAPIAAIVSAHALPIDDSWLASLVAPFADSRVAMVYGAQRGVARSRFAETRDFARAFGTESRDIRPPHYFANNANSAIRRDLWFQCPFDEHLPGLEDIAWAKHWLDAGYLVRYEPSAGVYHIHEESWRQVRHRFYREAVAAKRIGVKHARHALEVPFREASYTLADLASAVRARMFRRHALDVVRFRASKAIGTVRGLLTTPDFEHPLVRQAVLFDRHQRAVVIRGPGTAAVEEIPLPHLKPTEVLVKVAYAGICGTDLEILNGSLGYYANGLAQYPIVPGHEFSGRIAAVGARAGAWSIGDAVVVECIQGCDRCAECQAGNPIGCSQRSEVGVIRRDGGFSEYVAAPGRFVHRLPMGTDLRLAAVCEPLAVVLKGLRRASLHSVKPNAVGIVGGGPIGYLTARVLSKRGCDVVVFDRSPIRRALYGRATDDLARLRDLDFVVEATGDPAALDEVLRYSRAGSTILLLGLPYARRDFSFESIVAYDKTIIGSVGSAREDFVEAIRHLPGLADAPWAAGGNIVPLADFHRALMLMRERRHLKILLEVDPSLNDAPDPVAAGAQNSEHVLSIVAH